MPEDDTAPPPAERAADPLQASVADARDEVGEVGEVSDAPAQEREGPHDADDDETPPESPSGGADGTLHLPLTPAGADSVRWVAIASTFVAALALLVAALAGYAAMLGVTLVLALVLAWGWPVLAGSFTPNATSVVLVVSSVAIVLSALRDDLRWLAAAVAFGIVLSFLAQLIRRTGREGLVLTLLASFGGLAVTASGATAVVAANTDHGTAVAVIAMAAVGASVVADLLAGRRAVSPLLGIVALVVSSVVAMLAGSWFDGVSALTSLGIGAAAGTVSWSLRRVFALSPAMVTVRGQVGAGVGSVLAIGAIVNLFAALG
ncbi:hypothetical protein [Intrasporangium mesophilum]